MPSSPLPRNLKVRLVPRRKRAPDAGRGIDGGVLSCLDGAAVAARRDLMQVRILVAQGKVKQQRVKLELPVIVGRSTDADLTINHPAVSRQHCELFEADGRVRVRDLGSTNGTRVGGEKVVEAVLRPHDRFSIGPFTLVVDYRESPDAAAALPGDRDQAALGVANKQSRKVVLPEPSSEEEGEPEDAGDVLWDEGPVSDQAPPDRPADAPPVASSPAKPSAQASPAASVPQSKKPAKAASTAAGASSTSGPDPELGIDLDELLDALEGVNLKDFLKGIE